MEKGIVGKIGEDIAHDYLKKKGYRTLARNYRKKYGEIDIIAVAPDKTLVFVEVKTMTASTHGEGLIPEDQMSSAKLRKSKRISQIFAASHQDLIREDKGWRIDLLSILIEVDNFGYFNKEKTQITHHENI